MQLNSQEEQLITEFRNLGESARGDVMAFVSSLARRTGTTGNETVAGQCSVRTSGKQTGSEKEEIFTE